MERGGRKSRRKEERWICTHAVCLGSRDNAANSPGLSGVKKGPSFCRFSVSPSPLALLIRRLRSAFSFPPFYLSLPLPLSFSLSLSVSISVSPRFFTLFFFSSFFLSFTLLFTPVVPRLAKLRLQPAQLRSKLIQSNDSSASNIHVDAASFHSVVVWMKFLDF